MWICCGMSLTPSTYLTQPNQSVVLKVLIPISTIHHCYDFSKPEPDQNSNFVDPKKNQQHIPSLRKEELIQPICNRIISNTNKCTPRYLSILLCSVHMILPPFEAWVWCIGWCNFSDLQNYFRYSKTKLIEKYSYLIKS